MSILKNLIIKESGSAIILTALAMVVLIGFAALAVDGGNLYYRHTRLQDVADSCALAGCMELATTKNQAAAIQKVADYAEHNALTVNSISGNSIAITYGNGENGSIMVSFPDGSKRVKVEMEVVSDLYFARVLGFNMTPVGVSATAKNGPAIAQSDLIPVAFFHHPYEAGKTYQITLDPGDQIKGNAGYVNFDEGSEGVEGKGKNNFTEYMESGYPGIIELFREVGMVTGEHGNVKKIIDDRIARGDNIVTIPIIGKEDFEAAVGCSGTVTVINFARFEITAYVKVGNEHHITGRFLNTASPGGAGDGDADDYAIKGVCLVE